VNSLNFSLMSEREQEAILEGFRLVLHSLGGRSATSIHIRIEPYDRAAYAEQIRACASPAAAAFVEDHLAFVDSLAARRALVQRRYYILLAADDVDARLARRKTQEELFAQAQSQLEMRCSALVEALERIGLAARRMQRGEIANYYRSCWHAQAAKMYPLSDNALGAAEHLVRALPAHGHGGRGNVAWTQAPQSQPQAAQGSPGQAADPDGVRLAEIVSPSSLEITRTYVRTHSQGIDEYLRGLAVVAYPGYVTPGWFDRLIQIDEPGLDVTLYVRPLDGERYAARMARRLVSYRATQQFEARRGRTPDPHIQVAREDVEQLQDKLVRLEEQVFAASLYILVRAASRTQLRERTGRVYAVLKSLEIGVASTVFEHHLALLSTLPEGNNVLRREKVLDTSSLVTAFPFTSNTLSTAGGALTGVMPSGELVILDPFSEQLENANIVKFAKSGAGKSYESKVALFRYLLAGIAAVVIDPDDEYLRAAQAVGGQTVRLSSGNFQINPLELYPSGEKDRNILEEKFQSNHTLMDLLLADRNGALSQKEKGYLNKCFYRVYRDCGITPDPTTHHNSPPSIEDLYQVLRQEVCGPDVHGLADRLERYVTLFPRQTIPTLDNDFLVFAIRDLDAELRPVGLFLITDYVWAQMRRPRLTRKKRILLIDEAWSLMQFPEGGRFLSQVARRARKYDLGVVTITQDVEDFLNSEQGRTILVNSSIKLLMKQDPATVDSVVQAFHLSEGERRYLLAAGKGQALLFARSSHVPLQVLASPFEHAFATTNARELYAEPQEG
jgi:TraG P-loop domain